MSMQPMRRLWEIGQWLEQARAGSRPALGQLLELCQRYLLLIANQELDSELQAKCGASDVVQETFLEAQQGFGKFRGTSAEELYGWLRQILRHNLQNVRRHYQGTEKRDLTREQPLPAGDSSNSSGHPLESPAPSPSTCAARNEETEALDRALGTLDPHYREVILLHHRERLTFEQIGSLMNRSPEAVRKLWARAIERLQQQLDASPDSQPGTPAA